MARYRKLVGTLLSLVLGIFLTTVGLAGPAAAWRSQAVIGQPGAVFLPQISVSDIALVPQTPVLTFSSATGPVVHRSPDYDGPQSVIAMYFLQRRQGDSNGWVTVTQKQFATQMTVDQNVARFPALFMQPITGSNIYRVTFTFHWFAADTNVVLGAQSWISDTSADHSCVTPRRPCISYAGFVYVGAIT